MCTGGGGTRSPGRGHDSKVILSPRMYICTFNKRRPHWMPPGLERDGSLGREVLLITQNDEDIPFDLRHLRYLKYLNNAEGRRALGTALTARAARSKSSTCGRVKLLHVMRGDG
jgi:hypothetical protein